MKRFLTGLALLAAIAAAPSAVMAQAEDAGPNTGSIRVGGGVDYTTAYFFRGYNQEDTGLILQPYANLYFDVVKSDDVNATVYVGTWNSLHEEKTLADPDSSGQWYESDFVAGVDVSCSKGMTLGVVYTAYTYPGGAFDTIEELGLKLAWDDTQFSEGVGIPFALKPYAAIYFETDDDNGSEDSYLELGIAPTVYTFDEKGDMPISIGVPVTLGLSLDDYYFDEDGDEELLGYLSVGLSGSLPLPVPDEFGAWSLTGTVQYIHLFADSAENANDGGEDHELLGKLGVSFAY